jgi:hypothetical protein
MMNETIEQIDWNALYSVGKHSKEFTFDMFDPLLLAENPASQNWSATVTFRDRYGDRANAKKNIIFRDGVPAPHELQANHPWYMVKPEHSVKGEDKENDKLWRKYNKLELKLDEVFLGSFFNVASFEIQSFLIEAGWYSRKFSMRAGCSMCPCSPGYNLKSANGFIKNVAIDVAFKEKK